MTVLIAGGGIAGLTLGLTLHQIGIPFHVFERVSAPKPLGVGINLQPPAVRELFALGLEEVLSGVGVATKDYGFYTRTGVEIWTEPRGRLAGYNWPQYSVHRGHLQMELQRVLVERCGPDCISFGNQINRYETYNTHVVADVRDANGRRTVEGRVLVGADGIHSAVREQMYPDEGAPVWGGAIMWRGTTRAKPFLSGKSMILAGNNHIRFVSYPISDVDPDTGHATVNWIAERTVDPETHVAKEDWNREVTSDRFAESFSDWDFGWVNIPELIREAQAIFEYPMVDREPVESWTDGRVGLIGDAAHATYPVGSSGASQAILDARILGAEIRARGTTQDALASYEQQVCPMANAVTLANRGRGGPDAIMQMAEDRCDGDFSLLDKVLPKRERADHAEDFKRLAGITVEETNKQASII